MRLVKTSMGLSPYTDEDAIELRRVGIGDILQAKALDQRNVQHHRKFFALIRVVYDNMPEQFDRHFPTKDDLRHELIKRAGFYKEYIDLKGNKQYRAESISFDSMGQKRFDDLYNRVLDVVVQWFLFDRDVLESEIMQFAD
jgi:aminopeptidase C